MATYTVLSSSSRVPPIRSWVGRSTLLGAAALASVAINSFLLPPLLLLTPWFGILGALGVMAYPWYSDGLVRALVVFGYAFCCAPVLWAQLTKAMGSLQTLIEREAFFPRLGRLRRCRIQ
ncbi:hypothetical protein HPP92_028332 [Vanilla planifolia]|uniref:Uncharacterized protein n=1 Tax=Vanilla planifolia TaxID=51239 RepID=A0A835P882_VANPL|nr:hypothetical protein HPP92_028332 [Vanilla planifolia]